MLNMGSGETQERCRCENTNASILDKKPLRVFHYPLTITQQIWLGFVVPSIIMAIVFIANFALNIAVVWQLFRVGQKLQAAATGALVYAPAIFCLILTLTRPPKLQNVCNLIIWVTIQILHCIFFPIGIIYRFSTRLFWSIAALTDKGAAQEQSLQMAGAAHQSELFFLMNSFLNAAPQSVLQAYLMLSQETSTPNETVWVQALNVITSVITLSITMAQYQRFESQRAVGRPVPWTLPCNHTHARTLVNITKLDVYYLMGIQKSTEGKEQNERESRTDIMHNSGANVQEPLELSEEISSTLGTENSATSPVESTDEIPSTLTNENLATGLDEPSLNQPKGINSIKLTIRDSKSSALDSHDKITDEPEERDALLQPTEKDLSEQSHHPVTSHETGSLAIQDEPQGGTVTMEENIAPLQTPDEIIRIALPIRKPRTKGLDEDEPMGIFTIFHAWSSYLMARILVLATFTHFYAWPSLGLILCHYAIMISYLCFCNPCLNYWAPILGLLYILCPVEVNVRYKYPRLFLISFFALVTLEDTSTIVVWYITAEWNSWWYDWIFYFVIGSHLMAALNVGLYLCICKPKNKYKD